MNASCVKQLLKQTAVLKHKDARQVRGEARVFRVGGLILERPHRLRPEGWGF